MNFNSIFLISVFAFLLNCSTNSNRRLNEENCRKNEILISCSISDNDIDDILNLLNKRDEKVEIISNVQKEDSGMYLQVVKVRTLSRLEEKAPLTGSEYLLGKKKDKAGTYQWIIISEDIWIE